jgi:hypothetical protein
MQSEEGVEFASRQRVQFRTADGDTFDVTFASDAELPDRWPSPKSGKEGVLLSPDGTPVDLVEIDIKTARTHWDMLLERRTRDELEELLQERLTLLRERRGGSTRKRA